MATTQQFVIAPAETSSGVVTDATEIYADLYPGDNLGLRIDIERESDDGTATLAAAIEWQNRATGDWNALLDLAGNGIAFNAWADDEADKRFIVISPRVIGVDVDGVLAVGNNFYYQQHLMDVMRLVLTHGGTDVENVFNITGTWLP